MSDTTPTTVPFFSHSNNSVDAIVKETQERMKAKLQAFDNAFR
jgi:hypothetical protein